MQVMKYLIPSEFILKFHKLIAKNIFLYSDLYSENKYEVGVIYNR